MPRRIERARDLSAYCLLCAAKEPRARRNMSWLLFCSVLATNDDVHAVASTRALRDGQYDVITAAAARLFLISINSGSHGDNCIFIQRHLLGTRGLPSPAVGSSGAAAHCSCSSVAGTLAVRHAPSRQEDHHKDLIRKFHLAKLGRKAK